MKLFFSKLSKKSYILLFVGLGLATVLASFYLNTKTALANCGVQGGDTGSYAGAIVSAYWTDSQGNKIYSSNTAVRVQSNNGSNVVRTDSSNYNTQQRESDVHFNPIAGCVYGGQIRSVVLGYGTTSPAASNGSTYWSLDCRTDSGAQVAFTFSKGVGAATPVTHDGISAPANGTWSSLPNKYVTNGGTKGFALVYTPPPIVVTNPDFDIRNRLMDGTSTQLSDPGSYTAMPNDTNYNNPSNNSDDSPVSYSGTNTIYYKPASSSCSGTGCVTRSNYKKWNFVSDAKAGASVNFNPTVSAPNTITVNGIAWKLYGYTLCTNSTTCWTSGLTSTTSGAARNIGSGIAANTIKNAYWAYRPDMPTCTPGVSTLTVTANTNPVNTSFTGTNAESASVSVFNTSNTAYEIASGSLNRSGGTFSYSNQPNGTTYRYTATFVNDRGVASCSTDVTKQNPLGTVDLKVNNSDGPVTVAAGAALTASWSGSNLSTGTNPCTATATPTTNTWTGAKPTSGSGVGLDNTTVGVRDYNISCTTSSGSTATDAVRVTVVAPPSVTLRANNNTGTVYVNINDPLSLTWTSSNVTSCSASVPVSNPAITTWSGAKATNNSTGENHNADTAASNTITYRITCNGNTGSNPSSATSDVNVVINSAQYYPWLQTDGGDVRSVGKIVGQSLGLASNLNDNPGGRRYSSAANLALPSAEAKYLVVGSGSGNNFCSFNLYNLGVAQSSVQTSCATGGYSPASIDFGAVASSVESAWLKNGAGVGDAKSKCIPHNTAIVGTAIDTNLNLGCTDANGPVCTDGTPVGSPTCPVGSPNIVQTYNPSPSAGGGIQKKETGAAPSNVFNLTPGAALTVSGRGTLWVTPANNVTEPSVVSVTQNITYPATVTLSAPSQLPNFAIFVEGDVYISNSVTRIDATIIATGSIYSCGESVSLGNNPGCSNNLVANGLWASGGPINFGRRAYNKDAPTAAEKVILTVQSLAFPAPGLSKKDSDINTGLEIDPNEYQPRLQ